MCDKEKTWFNSSFLLVSKYIFLYEVILILCLPFMEFLTFMRTFLTFMLTFMPMHVYNSSVYTEKSIFRIICGKYIFYIVFLCSDCSFFGFWFGNISLTNKIIKVQYIYIYICEIIFFLNLLIFYGWVWVNLLRFFMSPSGNWGCGPALNSSLVVYKSKYGGLSFVNYLRSLSFTVFIFLTLLILTWCCL